MTFDFSESKAHQQLVVSQSEHPFHSRYPPPQSSKIPEAIKFLDEVKVHPQLVLDSMESDRSQANLEPSTSANLEQSEQPKQPKKRFIGRKAAAEQTERRGQVGGIEDNAVPGLLYHSPSKVPYSRPLLTSLVSRTTQKDSSNSESDPRRYT